MVKHSTIYPSPEELEAVQNMVSTVECALKHVSDWLDETNKGTKAEGETEVKKDEAVDTYSKWVWPDLCGALLQRSEKLRVLFRWAVLGSLGFLIYMTVDKEVNVCGIFLSYIWNESKKRIIIRPEKEDGLVQDAFWECTKPFKTVISGDYEMSPFSCVGLAS